MKEYEYSFKVESLDPYLKYCLENKYKLIEDTKQTRLLCRNDNKTLARITIKESNGVVIKQLDFKDDIESDDILIERRESMPIEFEDENAVDSILEFLNYRKDKLLIRRRMVYRKGDVTFEIDDYDAPEKAFVIAIEGEKNEVDKVYKEVENLF